MEACVDDFSFHSVPEANHHTTQPSRVVHTQREARGLITTQLRRELSVATHAGHARMLLSRRAYVGLSHEGARALGDRRAGDHQGIAVFIPPTTEGARRRAQRARAHGGGGG